MFQEETMREMLLVLTFELAVYFSLGVALLERLAFVTLFLAAGNT